VRTATLNNRVQDFIVAHPQLFIDRQLIDAKSDKTIKTINPATEETLATIADDGAVDVDLAVHAARRAFDDGPWSRMTPSERLRRAARSSTVGGR
jgi:acyl-CoA reductase-like NAD-dependent aldehyde dehydrogenase